MKTIVKITMIGLFLFSFPIGSLAQEVENPKETVIGNTWYLTKLVMDQEEYPFVPDDSQPNVPMEIYYLDEEETYGVIESEFRTTLYSS